MRHLITLIRHELRALFIAPASYIAAVLFLLVMGFIYFYILEEWSLREQNVHPLDTFFRGFILPALIVVPLLTMRSIAEERRLGTLETLMTTPVTAGAVVVSKFVAAYFFYCCLWLLTLSFPLMGTWVLQRPDLYDQLISPGIMIGGYAFIFLTGTLFIAVGILASSLTRSQLVAGMLTFSILFILIAGAVVINQDVFNLGDAVKGIDAYVNGNRHLDLFVRGIIDSRPFFFYLSNAALVLGVATLVVEAKA